MVLKLSKESGCEVLKRWIKAIRNHLYWCATSTRPGFELMIVGKWKSFVRHVANKHKDHQDDLYKECSHGDDIERREWIKIGTKAHDKLKLLLTKTRVLNDVLNHWHPKMVHFSWMGTFCRHIMACLHFNENVNRDTMKSGKPYIKVTYPKYKVGEELVREIVVPATYGYVDDMQKLMFSSSKTELKEIYDSYQKRAPEPLTKQFDKRLSRDEAIKRQTERKQKVTELFPSAGEQQQLESTLTRNEVSKRNAPCCKKCGNPMKGHKATLCQASTSS